MGHQKNVFPLIGLKPLATCY